MKTDIPIFSVSTCLENRDTISIAIEDFLPRIGCAENRQGYYWPFLWSYLAPKSIYISAYLNGLIPKTQIDGHNPGQMKDGEKGC